MPARRSRGARTRIRWASCGRSISPHHWSWSCGSFRRRSRVSVGGYFPSMRFPDQPIDRWAMVKWLLVAERDAGLPKLVGGVWHPYRRQWAMERKHWPIRDVAAVGGWKSIRSLVECIAQSDRETMRAVVNESRKLFATDLEPSQLATREPWSPPRSQSERRRTSQALAATGRRTTRRLVSHVRVGAVRRVAPSSPKVAPPPRK